jgi:pimeloyl-ACP methyl ester carboxylesterase
VSRDGLAIPIELSISTRYIVAPADGALAPPQLLNLRRTPNDLPPPTLPSGDEVILFVHGHSSGAEEAVELIPHLIQAGLERGKKYSVISLDLPNNGYSDTFHDTDVALESSTSYPDGPPPHDSETIKTPILDFIDDFIVSFVDELDKKIFGPAGTPIRDRMVVIGGSLGGNMGLRLGRRSRPSSPWVAKNIVAWSAASVWKPMLKAPAKNGPKHCMVEFTKAETDDARENYFRLVYDHVPLPLVIKQQPEYWYRSGWNAKDFQILLSRIARREIYNENYRRWHWRVAGEQLVYSHLDNVEHGRDETPKRYELNTVRTLLVAGEVDNYSYVGIYDGTRQLAEAMTTPGRLLLVKDSGHSIHFEYPRFLADQIARFLNAREMQIDRVGREGGRIERVGGTNVNDGTPFVLTRQECIDAINRGDEFFVTSASGEEILVRVVGTYIRSTADHEEDNNLGALPDL